MSRIVGTYVDPATRADLDLVTKAEGIGTATLLRQIIKHWRQTIGVPRIAAAARCTTRPPTPRERRNAKWAAIKATRTVK